MRNRVLGLFVRFFVCWGLACVLLGCAASGQIVPSSSYLPSSAAMLAQEERLALPDKLQAKLQAIGTPPCRVAENGRADPRYVGDVGDTLWRVEMRLAFEVLKWIAENEEKEPRLHALQARQMQPLPPMVTVAAEAEPPQPWLERPGTQYTGGFVSGAIIGAVPFGPNLVNVPIEAKLLPKGTYWARVGRACGEIASGTAQMVLGGAGMGGGAGMICTGGGAPAGIVVFSGSMAIAANGCVTASHGVDTLFSAGEPPDAPSEPPRSHTILLQPKKPSGQTPVAAQASKAEAPKVAEPIPEAPPPGVMTVKKSPGGTVTSTRRRAPPGEEPPEIRTTITTNETGSVTTTTTKPLAAELKPYNKGAGHHVPAKRALEGAPGYDANKALAIPKAELKKLGVHHGKITNAQQSAYTTFDKTGKPLTWEVVAKIETEALVKAEMNVDVAKATVAAAIQALKDSGITGPIRIPWGK